MVIKTYIPEQQGPSILKERLNKMSFVLVDRSLRGGHGGFEQYCKCDNQHCLDPDADKNLSYEHPPNRNLVTLFRNIRHEFIGEGEAAGVRLSYVDLVFTGGEEMYEKVLSEIPEVNEKTEPLEAQPT